MAGLDRVEALLRAVKDGDVEGVERLLDQDGGLLEARDERDSNMTPLIWAAEQGHVQVVTLLLDRGAELEARDADGDTALLRAAACGHEEIVRILLNRGGDVRTENMYGVTPLREAVGEGHLGVVRLLVQHLRGHDLDGVDIWGCTALWWACRCGHTEVAQVLLLAGADHTIPCHNEFTPLQAAETQNHEDTATLLKWWEGELERGYVVHRARYHMEQNAILQPYFQALASVPATRPVPAHLRPRLSLPHVETVASPEGHEVKEEGSGKRKEAEQGGEGPCKGEKDATLKYIMHDLAPELYIELMAGFH